MFHIILALGCAGLLYYATSYAWSFLSHYQAAKQSGFQTVLVPWDPDNIAWNILTPMVRGFLKKNFPASIYARFKVAMFGWEFWEKFGGAGIIARWGNTFIVVNPGENKAYVGDRELAAAIVARRKDFLQLELTSVFIGIFGENVMTANGQDWARQRRLIAPFLNDRFTKRMWTGAIDQAQQLVDYYTSAAALEALNKPSQIVDDLRRVAFNSLLSASYGIDNPWNSKGEVIPEGHRMAFSTCLNFIADNLILSGITPAKLADRSFMPEIIQKVGIAKKEFVSHGLKMLEQTRLSNPEKKVDLEQISMLDHLVKASKVPRDVKDDVSTRLYLSESEVLGNMFLVTVAGYETGATTFSFCITLLSIYPRVQAWALEQISQSLDFIEKPENFSYDNVLSHLPRCFAIMHEVLRLFPPVIHLSRTCREAQTVITPSGKTYNFPAKTIVYSNVVGIQTDPEFWGEDALEFKPERWIRKSTSSPTGEEFFVPAPGSFLAWSGGPRVCPGMRISQVEFVAVFMTILKKSRIEPVIDEEKGDKTVDDARERLKEVVEDCQPKTSLQLKRPEDIKLRFIPIA